MTGTGTLRWFKSSHSDSGGGGNCLEVAYDWRKSSYSDDGGGNCVEMAACPHAATIHIRDSKNPGGPRSLHDRRFLDRPPHHLARENVTLAPPCVTFSCAHLSPSG